MNPKRPWTRAEKALFLTPLLISGATAGVWVWRSVAPAVIQVPDVSWLSAVSWSPDSQRIAVFAYLQSPLPSQKIQGMVYEVRSRAKICDLALPPAPPQSLWFSWPSWSPDGTQIVTGYSDGSRGTTKIPTTYFKSRPRRKGDPGFHFNSIGKIALWNAASGQLQGNWPYAPPIEDSSARVYFSRNGKQLVGYGNPPSLFDAKSGFRLQRFGSAQTTEGFLNRGQNLVALHQRDKSNQTSVEVRDTRTSQLIWRSPGETSGSSQWNKFAVLGVLNSLPDKSSRLLLWNSKSRRLLPAPPFTTSYEFSFHSNLPWVALINTNNSKGVVPPTLVVWNYALNRVVWQQKLKFSPHSLSWSPDGKWLSLTEADDYRKQPKLKPYLISIFNSQGRIQLRRDIESLDYVIWAPDSQKIAIASRKTVEIVRIDEKN